MRFQVEPYKQDGDTRVITRFLLFPKRIGREVRWLEIAKIRQVYHGNYPLARWKGHPELGWRNERWEND